MAEEKISKQYLEGFTYSGSNARKVKEDGKERTVYIPFERPATPDDVLAWKISDGNVVIVMKDGKKYTVKAKAEKKIEPPATKVSTEFNVDQAADKISKMGDAETIKAFVKGDERKGVTSAAEAALAGLK